MSSPCSNGFSPSFFVKTNPIPPQIHHYQNQAQQPHFSSSHSRRFSNTSKANPKPHFTNPFQFLLSATFFNRWDLNFELVSQMGFYFFFFHLTRFSTFEMRSWGLRFLQSTAFSTTEVWILSHFLKLVWVSLISSNYNSWILNFRSFSQIRCLQSLLPLHTAVSSARLTSCLGIDSSSSRSLSQGMICSANPGVWYLQYFKFSIRKQLFTL